MSGILRSVSEGFARLTKNLSPTQILFIGFLITELMGSFLLWLPMASADNKSIDFIDAFFTATSALCVTGLTVKNTFAQWSLFGKIIIMILMEVGGLGFMTIITVFYIFAGKKITLKERLIIQESLNQLNCKGIVALVKQIFYLAVSIQGLGALILALKFKLNNKIGFLKSLFMGIFHSVSAFCNAGFDIIGENSFCPYVTDITINFTVMALIILGGIGFTVMADLIRVFKDYSCKKLSPAKKISRLKLHSKLVLISTFVIIISGAVLIFLCEYSNPKTMGSMSFAEKSMASLFQSVTSRSAGANTLNESALRPNSKIVTIVLMFIGGSPGGTAGGIKTVTAVVLVLAVLCAAKGKNKIEAFGRSISFYTLQRALAVTFFNFIVILGSTFILSALNPKFSFIDVLFEVTSAVGTVGLGLGLSTSASFFCKLILCADMIIGKLGPITVAITLLSRRKNVSENLINYPQEKVMIG